MLHLHITEPLIRHYIFIFKVHLTRQTVTTSVSHATHSIYVKRVGYICVKRLCTNANCIY